MKMIQVLENTYGKQGTKFISHQFSLCFHLTVLFDSLIKLSNSINLKVHEAIFYISLRRVLSFLESKSIASVSCFLLGYDCCALLF